MPPSRRGRGSRMERPKARQVGALPRASRPAGRRSIRPPRDLGPSLVVVLEASCARGDRHGQSKPAEMHTVGREGAMAAGSSAVIACAEPSEPLPAPRCGTAILPNAPFRRARRRGEGILRASRLKTGQASAAKIDLGAVAVVDVEVDHGDTRRARWTARACACVRTAMLLNRRKAHGAGPFGVVARRSHCARTHCAPRRANVRRPPRRPRRRLTQRRHRHRGRRDRRCRATCPRPTSPMPSTARSGRPSTRSIWARSAIGASRRSTPA